MFSVVKKNECSFLICFISNNQRTIDSWSIYLTIINSIYHPK